MTAQGAAKSPGYPHPKPCLSFWLQNTRGSALIGHRTTPDLPTHQEVVIIGAGMSGAATAYFLLTGPDPPKSVAILEAREACHGATGRNGGHCRPDRSGYTKYKGIFGKEQAMKIIQNEADNFDLVAEIIDKEGIDCDFERCSSFDVATDQHYADILFNSYEAFRKDGGQVDGIVEWISDPATAKQRTRCKDAIAATEFPAATFWPYKFVARLLDICISKYGLNLQTSTPALSVKPSADSGSWTIKTARGCIEAQKVVYATNAYTATLLPEFTGHITPYLGQCGAIVPTVQYSGPNILRETYQFNDKDYMLQRAKDGIIIIGVGGRHVVPIEKLLGCTDDSVTLPEITEHFRSSASAKGYLDGWGKEAVGEGLLCDWTGIMGYTPEMVPFVGEVEGKRNAFVNAGHSGHGMSRVMAASKGLAAIMRGEPWENSRLPECFQPTPKRLGSRGITEVNEVKRHDV